MGKLRKRHSRGLLNDILENHCVVQRRMLRIIDEIVEITASFNADSPAWSIEISRCYSRFLLTTV